MRLGVDINKKIVRKRIQGTYLPNQEEVMIQLETTWTKNNLETVRLILAEDQIIEITPTDLGTLSRTLDHIFSEAQTIKNDDITIEWILTIDNNEALHVAVEKTRENNQVDFQLSTTSATTKISISEEKFKRLIDFIESIISSHEKPTKETDIPDTITTASLEQREVQRRNTTRLQDRIAELKAQFYRDIEMIAKELEQETSKATKVTASQELVADMEEETTSSLELEDVLKTEGEITGGTLVTNTPVSDEDVSPQISEEWMDSLESLLNAESDDEITEDEEDHNDVISSSEQVTSSNHEVITEEITNEASMSSIDLQEADASNDSHHRTLRNEKEQFLPPPHPHITENKEALVTESLLEKELEEFFGRMKNKKSSSQENDH